MARKSTVHLERELLERLRDPLKGMLEHIESVNQILSQLDEDNGEKSSGTKTPSKVLKDVTSKVGAFSEALGKVTTSTNGVGSGVLRVVKQAAEHDNIIRNVGNGLGIHGDALNQYVSQEKVKLNELARTTGQSSDDLTKALGFFSREGFRREEQESLLAITAKIATAYSAHPEAVAKSAFSLKESLGIDDAHLSGALASVGVVGKNANLSFETLAPLLPQVAAEAGSLGIKGRSGVNDLTAALAVARQGTGTESDAVNNTRAFLQTITSSSGAKAWRDIFHEDLYKLEARARKNGQDPMMVVMNRIQQRAQQGGDITKMLSKIFQSQQDRGFVTALLEHWDQYQNLHRLASGADQSVIDLDYADNRKSELVQVRAFEDALAQLMRRIGDDFAPILARITNVVNSVNVGLEKMDHALPGVSTYLIGAVGALLGLVTVLAAVGAVATAVSAGVGVLGAVFTAVASGFGILGVVLGAISWPVSATIAAIVAMGVALYEGWKHWDQIKVVLNHAGQAVVEFINKIINVIPGAVRHVLHPDPPPTPKPEQLGPDGKWKFAPSPAEKWKQMSAGTASHALPPPLPVQRQDSRIQLRIYADEGLKAKAQSHHGRPLDVHVHGGLNSMMGRP